MISKFLEWLRSPHTLVKLIRIWVVLGLLTVLMFIIAGESGRALMLSVLLIVYFYCSNAIERVILGKKNEDSTERD